MPAPLLQQPRQSTREASVFGWVENIQHKPRRAPDGNALRRLLARLGPRTKIVIE